MRHPCRSGKSLAARARSGLVILVAGLAIGWGGAGQAWGEELKIGGTGNALGCMRLLGAAFSQAHPDSTVTVLPSLGSDGGIKAVLGGAIDLAVSSRPPSEEERAQGATGLEYGRTAHAFVTHAGTRAHGFTLDEIASLYRGDLTTWPDGSPIRLVMRPAHEFNTKYLRHLSPEMDQAVEAALSRTSLPIAVTDQENLEIITTVPGSFGNTTLAQIRCEGRRNIKALAVNGIQPAAETIENGRYPLLRRNFFVTRGEPAPAAAAFIDFVLSPDGARIVRGVEEPNAQAAQER